VENISAALLLHLRRAQGRLSEIEARIERHAVEQGSVGGWSVILAMLRCEIGRPELARETFELAAQDDFARIERDVRWPSVMMALARIGIAVEDSERAALIYRLLLPQAGRMGSNGYSLVGPVDMALASLAAFSGDIEAAERHAAAAADLCEKAGTVVWLPAIYCQVAGLRLRTAPSDARGAIRYARKALELAERIGLRAVCDQATQLLDRARGLTAE
jgi:hypothetical protein